MRPVAKYLFLSDEWIDEARKIREEYRGQAQPLPHAVRMNQEVTDVPFGEGTIHAHIDSSSGTLEIETGHLDDPDLTLTLDYETAKAVFVDPQVGTQAFLQGKIVVQGDLSKLLAMQATPMDPSAAEVQRRIRDITE